MSKRCMLILIALLAVSSVLSAQVQTGNIIGKVTDKGGEALPGVALSISGPSLIQKAATAVANEKGAFRFFSVPPGSYTLTAELSGFEKLQRTEIRVRVGETVSLDLVLTEGAIDRLVTVTAAPPSIDVKKSDVSTVLTAEVLRSLPIRTYDLGMVNLAPGVADRASQGSGSTSGQFQVDGQNVTGQWYGDMRSDIPPDLIEETEVITAGGTADAGEYTGALINVITKNGGNEFKGELNLYFFNDKMVNYRANEVSPPATHLDASIILGGPIIKNRLWFILTGAFRRDKTQAPNYLDEEPTVSTRPNLYAKVNYLINDKNKGYLSYQYNEPRVRYGVDQYTPPSALGRDITKEHLLNIQHQMILSQDTFLDLKLNYRKGFEDMVPDSMTESMRYDIATGMMGGGYGVVGGVDDWRFRAMTDIAHYKDAWFLGSHEFKAGFTLDRSKGTYRYGWINNAYYMDNNGALYMKYEQDRNEYGPRELHEVQAYVQDIWTPIDRLNISLGLRFSHTLARIPDLTAGGTTYAGNPKVFDWNNVAPRLGLTYALTRDSKTIFKASFGRFYDFAAWHFFTGYLPYSRIVSLYMYMGDEWILVDRQGGATNQEIDPDLKRPYSDILTVGLQRELARNFTAEINYVHKYFGNQITEVNTAGRYEETTATDPGTGESVTVYNQTNPGENYYVKTNPPEMNYKYDGIQLVLTKRQSDQWFLQASLHLQKSEGLANNDPYASKQAAYVGPFRDPNYMTNAYGPSSADRAYQVKVLAGYFFRPLGINISGTYFYMQGLRYSRQFTAVLNQGYVQIYAEPRNSLLADPIQQLDVRLEKELKVGPGRLGFLVDVHNVFNSDTPSSISDVLDLQTEPRIYGRQDPRFFQLGIRYRF